MASGDSLPSFDTVTLSFHTCVPIPHASRCALRAHTLRCFCILCIFSLQDFASVDEVFT